MPIQAKLYNQEGKEAGVIDLPPDLFAVRAPADLIHQAFRTQLANSRVAIANTKGRGEVSGGGKKPWRQKGTGRARHGSTRSPLWIGGGVTFGPTKDRNYSKALPKKMKRKAVLGVLSGKFRDGEIIFIDKLIIDAPKTKKANVILQKLLLILKPERRSSQLIFTNPVNKDVYRAFRNLPRTKVIAPANLNVGDMLNFRYIFMPQESVEALKKIFGAKIKK